MMATPDPELLRRECEVFSRYLGGGKASEYTVAKYVRGHRAIPYLQKPIERIDPFLVGLAKLGPLATSVADSYSRAVRPTSALRQKLVLLLAILENSPAVHREFNSSDTSAPGVVVARLIGAGTGFALSVIAGLILIGLPHLVLRVMRPVALPVPRDA